MAVFIVTPPTMKVDRTFKSECTMFGRVHVHYAFQTLMRVYLQTCIYCVPFDPNCAEESRQV